MLKPRASYLTAPLGRTEKAPPAYSPELTAHLPPEITELTGKIHTVRMPEQGVCNLLLQLDAERGSFVLKVAREGYRSQELWAEHAAMQVLEGSPVPVPRSLAFARHEGLSIQLREYLPGRPLSEVLKAEEALRPEAIRQMGQTLAAIHALRPDGASPLPGGTSPLPGTTWTWEQWREASLIQAGQNFAAGVYDPEDFTPQMPPEAAITWLHANQPSGGTLCLLHGDYRPKNLLWRNGHITGVIDWAFVDLGDPYYDLSIFRYYMRGEAEWNQFLDAYGLTQFSQQRFDYCMTLHKFLNI